MSDLFQKFENNMGPLGKWASIAEGYFVFPKLEGKISNRMTFNGKEVINFPVEGEEWDSMVAGTKFANCDEKPWDNCEFGKFKSGKICLQDHGGSIYFRNIKIKELEL